MRLIIHKMVNGFWLYAIAPVVLVALWFALIMRINEKLGWTRWLNRHQWVLIWLLWLAIVAVIVGGVLVGLWAPDDPRYRDPAATVRIPNATVWSAWILGLQW